jgi:hypothetical protein
MSENDQADNSGRNGLNVSDNEPVIVVPVTTTNTATSNTSIIHEPENTNDLQRLSSQPPPSQPQKNEEINQQRSQLPLPQLQQRNEDEAEETVSSPKRMKQRCSKGIVVSNTLSSSSYLSFMKPASMKSVAVATTKPASILVPTAKRKYETKETNTNHKKQLSSVSTSLESPSILKSSEEQGTIMDDSDVMTASATQASQSMDDNSGKCTCAGCTRTRCNHCSLCDQFGFIYDYCILKGCHRYRNIEEEERNLREINEILNEDQKRGGRGSDKNQVLKAHQLGKGNVLAKGSR